MYDTAKVFKMILAVRVDKIIEINENGNKLKEKLLDICFI